jgi:ATP-dependent Clp protease adaptor protein ClpS
MIGANMSTEIQTAERTSVSVKPPKLWKVIFLNDDQTPMDFVMGLLTSIFKHNENSARDLTMEIHNEGSAVAGVYSHEIAEQRGLEATHLSRLNGFPLQINLEEDE